MQYPTVPQPVFSPSSSPTRVSALDLDVQFEQQIHVSKPNAPLPVLKTSRHASSTRTSKHVSSQQSSRKPSKLSSTLSRRPILPDLNPDAYIHRHPTVKPLPSFLFGACLGVLPVLIPIRYLVSMCVKSERVWNGRWLRYGRSFGLILFIIIIIVLLAVFAA